MPYLCKCKRVYEQPEERLRCTTCTEIESLRSAVREQEEEVERWKATIGGAQAACTLDTGCEAIILRKQLAQVKLDASCDEAALLEIYAALAGLPITGEHTGPHTAKHLDAVDQIKALRKQLAAKDAALCEAREALEEAHLELAVFAIVKERK